MQQAFLEQDIGFTFITVLSTASYWLDRSQKNPTQITQKQATAIPLLIEGRRNLRQPIVFSFCVTVWHQMVSHDPHILLLESSPLSWIQQFNIVCLFHGMVSQNTANFLRLS